MTEFKLWCSEATALPTEPQPLPNAGLLFVCASNISLFFHLASVAASRQRANSEWVSECCSHSRLWQNNYIKRGLYHPLVVVVYVNPSNNCLCEFSQKGIKSENRGAEIIEEMHGRLNGRRTDSQSQLSPVRVPNVQLNHIICFSNSTQNLSF